MSTEEIIPRAVARKRRVIDKAERAAIATRRSVAEAARSWISRRESSDLARDTLVGYRTAARRIIDFFDALEVSSVTPGRVRLLMAHIVEVEGKSPQVANQARVVLGMIIDDERQGGLKMDENPVRRVRPMAIPRNTKEKKIRAMRPRGKWTLAEVVDVATQAHEAGRHGHPLADFIAFLSSSRVSDRPRFMQKVEDER